VAIVSTRSGQDYYMVFAAGAVFECGDAAYRGSMAGGDLHAPVVSAAACMPSGNGDWRVAADVGVFCFGDASSLGAPASS